MNHTINYDNAMESLGQALFEIFETNTPEPVKDLLEACNNGYLLIEWPESQEFMDKDWFEEEAILALGAEEKTGGSAYFIPIRRVI